MTTILDLCHEILHVIFEHLEPDDLSALARTCQTFHLYMQDNTVLWRNLYLQYYDDPRQVPAGRTPEWETELKQLTKVKIILQAKKESSKTPHVDLVCETAIRLATEADVSDDSKNLEFLRSHFDGLRVRCRTNASVFIHASSLFNKTPQSPRRRRKASPHAHAQKVAHLHCLHGVRSLPNADLDVAPYMEGTSLKAHSMARAHVYDLANYCWENKWGPFKDDGTLGIDWEKVEAIMIDLAFNLNSYDNQTGPPRSDMRCEPFVGVQPQSYESVDTEVSDDTDSPEASSSSHSSPISPIETSPYSTSREIETIPPQIDPSLQDRDPYGVTGTWERVVCFLDYNDFIRFNFDPSSRTADGSLPQQEALRLIRMKVRVTKIEAPSKEDGQELPVVHFEGRSCSMHIMWDPNANSRLTGK
jgi:hypothetical protein